MKFRVLDIETIPDMSVWTPGEDQYKVCPSREWHGRLEARRIEPFPPPHACRVVAISHVDILMDIKSSPRYRLGEVATACMWAHQPPLDLALEASLLGRFAGLMGTCDGEPDDSTTLVTWNGRTFDLPVLSMRSLKHGIPFGWYYKNRDMRYRYSDTGHLDLMDFLGDYGAGRNAKLGDVARLIGLPGKTDMTGASVLDIYRSTASEMEPGCVPIGMAEEKMKSVAVYCLQDTIETAIIFLRSRFHLGKIGRDEYNLCLETFAQSPEITGAISIDWPKIHLG
jgi:hypothetical protein